MRRLRDVKQRRKGCRFVDVPRPLREVVGFSLRRASPRKSERSAADGALRSAPAQRCHRRDCSGPRRRSGPPWRDGSTLQHRWRGDDRYRTSSAVKSSVPMKRVVRTESICRIAAKPRSSFLPGARRRDLAAAVETARQGPIAFCPRRVGDAIALLDDGALEPAYCRRDSSRIAVSS